MKTHKISGTVQIAVTLGNATYAGNVLVASTGVINPATPGADGVYAPASLATARLVNDGSIYGAAGAPGGEGGNAIDFATTGVVVNVGTLSGGSGGYAAGTSGPGGDGINLQAGGTVRNRGLIQGGAGGSGMNNGSVGGAGGIGVSLGSGGTVVNRGTILGGAGGTATTAGAGGVGVSLAVGATLLTHGMIAGGNAGNTLPQDQAGGSYNAAGGTGVSLSNNDSLLNTGTILGGTGGTSNYNYGRGGLGGAGVSAGSYDVISNAGTIAGGTGGTGISGDPGTYIYASGGTGGDGINGVNFTLTNTGLILGGTGGSGAISYGGNGGIGVYAQYLGSITNSGTIEGGSAQFSSSDFGFGGAAISMAGSGTITNTNTGVILGGSSTGLAYFGGFGGSGVEDTGALTLNNAGRIAGGAGGYGTYRGGHGGFGVHVYAGPASQVANAGTIVGGAGGASAQYGTRQAPTAGLGGYGVYLINNDTLTNSGLIAGGAGGNGYVSGSGGAGVELLQGSGAQIINNGRIYGGNGGAAPGYSAGSGGIGVRMVYGTLTNDGVIAGGAGGNSITGYGGAGGTGIFVSYGTVINAGTISAGAAGTGGTNSGDPGYAIQFGGGPGTLVIDPGAVFNGQVNASSRDQIILAGTADGTLSGLGTQFTGFGAITELAGANWTLINAEYVSGILTAYGVLSLNGVLTGSGTISAMADATVNLVGGGTFGGAFVGAGTVALSTATTLTTGASTSAAYFIDDTQLSLLEGTSLTNMAGNVFTLGIGPDTPAGFPNYSPHRVNPDITGASGDSFTNAGSFVADSTGAGTVGLAFDNTGMVSLTAGTLTFTGAVSGSGDFSGNAGTTLEFADGGMFGGDISSSGTVRIDDTTTLMSGASLSAPTIVDTAALTLGVDVTIHNAAGSSFTLGGYAYEPSGLPHRVNPDITGDTGSGITNAGTFFAVGPNTDTVAVGFETTGLVDAIGATLTFSGTVSGSGTITAGSGAMIDFADGASLAGMIDGAGTVEFGAATALNNGAHLDVASVIDTAVITLGNDVDLATSKSQSFTIGSSPNLPSADTGPHRVNPDITGASGDSFTNAGSFISVGPYTDDVSVAFINSGLVQSTGGTLAFLGAVSNTGVIDASSGRISIATDVSGTGSLQIDAGGTLSLLAGAGSGQTVDFTASTGTLNLTHPLTFVGTIEGFAGSDTIDLINTRSTSMTFTNNILTIMNGKQTEATLHFGAGYAAGDFMIQSDGHNGTLLTFV